MLDVSHAARGCDIRAIIVFESVDEMAHVLRAGSENEIEVIATMTREGDTLLLADVHVEAPESGSLGIHPLRERPRMLGRPQSPRSVANFGARCTAAARQGYAAPTAVIEVV